MKGISLQAALSGNTYPGRGVFLGRSADGKKIVIAYFIMGRSENSRNRIFVTEGEGIRTEAFDPSKLSDPSLIIYAPVRVLGDHTIVTNGDQTDTVYDFLKEGKSFADALMTRTFEPDPPNFTPRISGMVTLSGGNAAYRLSILKSANGNEASAERFFFDYENPLPGEGHLIHTYLHDGDPIPSFEGEPKRITLPDTDIDAFTAELWEALDPDNKVSLFTRYLTIADKSSETRIVNKNQA